MNDKAKINYIPASHGQVQPTKLAIRLFFYSYSGGGLQWSGVRWFAMVCSGLRWFAVAVVCGGLWWFACFSTFSPPILAIVPNSGGGLWWFEVVCGGLWWFVVVCGSLWWFAVVCGGGPGSQK